mmetsp:Transcript_11336/g.22946  ORF Transcript_11336/g.22946 Transcript_11336/m.22946 type:complete len:132 (-) Transcript_11336:2091-2486(-)
MALAGMILHLKQTTPSFTASPLEIASEHFYRNIGFFESLCLGNLEADVMNSFCCNLPSFVSTMSITPSQSRSNSYAEPFPKAINPRFTHHSLPNVAEQVTCEDTGQWHEPLLETAWRWANSKEHQPWEMVA